MGEARQTDGLSDATGRRAAGRLAARSCLKRFISDERGATLIEYAVILGVLSLSLVATFGRAQGVLINLINNSVNVMP
jgi:Flp pilus assembly pilin Flp